MPSTRVAARSAMPVSAGPAPSCAPWQPAQVWVNSSSPAATSASSPPSPSASPSSSPAGSSVGAWPSTSTSAGVSPGASVGTGVSSSANWLLPHALTSRASASADTKIIQVLLITTIPPFGAGRCPCRIDERTLLPGWRGAFFQAEDIIRDIPRLAGRKLFGEARHAVQPVRERQEDAILVQVLHARAVDRRRLGEVIPQGARRAIRIPVTDRAIRPVEDATPLQRVLRCFERLGRGLARHEARAMEWHRTIRRRHARPFLEAH